MTQAIHLLFSILRRLTRIFSKPAALSISAWSHSARAARAVLGSFARVVRAGLHRIWLVELALSFLLAGTFFFGWHYIQSISAAIREPPGFPSALVSVLAITNAISLLGANTYLARYSAFDKINEIFSAVSKITLDNQERFDGHPRKSKFARHDFYSWLFSRIVIESVDLSNTIRRYTWRPYWDGIWFFGSGDYNRPYVGDLRVFLTFHELLLTAIVVLRHVIRLRDTKAFVIESGSGSQGSRSFLATLRKYERILRAPLGSLSREDAIRLIKLAEHSTHYMFEEFRSQLRGQTWEEYRKLRFINLFVEYLIWLTYFQGKFLEMRAMNVISWGTKRGQKIDSSPLNNRLQDAFEVKSKLFELQNTIVPRRAIGEKVIQIRLGSLVPIVLTASALFAHAVLLPITSVLDIPMYSKLTTAAIYSLTCTAMAVNFVFGLWLLVPWRTQDREEWIYST